MTEKVQETAERGGRSQGPDLPRKQQKSGWGRQEEGRKGQAEPETGAVTELWQPRWADPERGILGKGRHPMEQSGKEGRDWREPQTASKGVAETQTQGWEETQDCAPSPDEGGSLGVGQEPNSTHSVGGRETAARAGQAFIMGEGHVMNWEGGRRNPEVQP